MLFSWGNLSVTSFITTSHIIKIAFFSKLIIYFSTNWVCSYTISTWETLSSVAQLCQTLCDPMDCSTPGFPVLHYLLEFAQSRVHWVGDAIQPSHPLLPPSPPALSLFQHQGLFQWISSQEHVDLENWSSRGRPSHGPATDFSPVSMAPKSITGFQTQGQCSSSQLTITSLCAPSHPTPWPSRTLGSVTFIQQYFSSISSVLDAVQGTGDLVVSPEHTAKWGEWPTAVGEAQQPHQGYYCKSPSLPSLMNIPGIALF